MVNPTVGDFQNKDYRGKAQRESAPVKRNGQPGTSDRVIRHPQPDETAPADDTVHYIAIEENDTQAAEAGKSPARPIRTKTCSLWRIFTFAWAHWRQFPLALTGVGVSLVALVGTGIVQPFLAGQLVDAVALNGGSADLATVFLALFAVAAVLNTVFRQIHDRTWNHLTTHAMARIAGDAFFRVQRFSTQWHADSFAGATVRQITRGMWALELFGNTLTFGFVPTVLMLMGAIAILGAFWPVMGLLIAGAVIVYGVIIYWLSAHYIGPANEAFVAQDSQVGAVLSDAVTCNATVKSFAAEAEEDSKLAGTLSTWRLTARRTWNRAVTAGLVQSVLLIALQTGLLSLALWFWIQGQATPGQITMVITTYLVLNGHLRDMGMHMRGLQQALNDIQDVVGFADTPLGIADRAGATSLVVREGHIVFDKVRFSYDHQCGPVYDRFSTEIRAGEKVALVGQSGSGKTTFVKLLQRLYDVEDGEIRVDGQNIARASQESLRRAIALVPQEPVLFHRSLAENIAYARPGASREEIESAAIQAHIHDFITALPKGYDTLVGERGVKLSGGERQRVAIARAFLADAPILILDEATSNLDSVTEDSIQKAMTGLMAGRTTILIAHRLSTIKAADRILVFSGGRIVEQGTHTDLLARSQGPYKDLYLTQYGPGSSR